MANNNGIKLLVVAAVVAVGYLGVSAYLRPVATVQVAAGGRVAKAVSAQIKVRAEKSLELKTEATGIIMNDLEDGRAVSAGDLLVQVDTRAKALEIDNLHISLRSSMDQNVIHKKSRERALKLAKDDLVRKESELKAGRLAPVAYDQAAAQVDQLEFRQSIEQVLADEAIARSQNSIKTRELELEKMTLIAPFAGTVTNLQVTKGALVTGGQTIATLISNTRVIEARISEENIADVTPGQRVRVWFTGMDADYTGTVEKILQAQEAQTLRYVAHLKLNVDNAKLEKTGLSGEGVITIDEKQARVSVPPRALYNNRLYVVRGGRVEVRTPKPGYVSESTVEILSGLEPGEEYIVDRQDLFRDGQRVRTQVLAAPAAK